MTAKERELMADSALVGCLMLCVYAALWILASGITRDHCESFGLEYGGTDMTFAGTCVVSSIKVPAELVSRD
jgi:hypothetical protein